ncbi:MAG: hypothetical protein ACLP5V_14870 [Candidatus Bathyarchaeia archaeon]
MKRATCDLFDLRAAILQIWTRPQHQRTATLRTDLRKKPPFQTATIESRPKGSCGRASIYEAKEASETIQSAPGYEEVLRVFGQNLNVLRSDEKFVFHSYTSEADERFNQLFHFAKGLDAFDLIILSEAFTVGELLTEDEDLLNFRDSSQFAESSSYESIKIRCWREVAREKTKS